MSSTLHYRPSRRNRNLSVNSLYIDHAVKPLNGRTPKRSIQTWFKLFLQKREKNSLYVKHIKQQLKSVGIRGIDLLKPEVYTLAGILNPDEKILAAISGRVKNEGSALIVVSDERVLYLNDIPLFTNLDEEGFENIRGISSSVGQWAASITLHTDIGDFKMESISIDAANNFIYVIEKYCLENKAQYGFKKADTAHE